MFRGLSLNARSYSFHEYGPYQFPEKLIPAAIQCVLARKPIPIYGDGLNVRDWLYVSDHVVALWQVNDADSRSSSPQGKGRAI